MTDKDRVRRRLQTHGTTTPLEWQSPTVDHGKPILRLAARINELRDEGLPIVTAKRRPVAVYALPAPVVVESDGQTSLVEWAA